MKIEALGVPELKRGLRGALDTLALNARVLDSLNVFPVPDGDTGINMLSTLKPAVEAVLGDGEAGVGRLCALLSEQANRNSRGNSGFILARFLAGFSRRVGSEPEVSAGLLSQGFASGSYAARSSLLVPVEGTMITIIAAMAAAMAATPSPDVRKRLGAALESARLRIFETPRQLPELARAGVVDAGGLGFILFVEGLIRGLAEEEIRLEDEQSYRFAPDPAAGEAEESRPGFRYCTELTVARHGEEAVDFRELKRFLEANGDSIAFVAEASYLKLHIHTDRPREIAARMAALGEVTDSKVDDMAGQLNKSFRAPRDREALAVLALIPGPGFRQIFADLEATGFLEYAERLPSAGEILAAIEAMESENVVVLPNDKNILPAAALAGRESGKNVYVLPTANVVQGLTALYGFSTQDDPEAAIRSMEESSALARCLKAYRSDRDADYGGLRIRKDDYFVVCGEDVLATGGDLAAAVAGALAGLDLGEAGCVSCFYNDAAEPAQLSRLAEEVRGLRDGLAVELCYGGQKSCLLVVAVE